MHQKPEIVIGFLACVVILLADGLEVKVKPTQDSVVKPQHASTVFTCQVENLKDNTPGDTRSITEKVKFQWIDGNGKEIQETAGRRYVEDTGDGLKLYFTRIEMSDAGTYTCKAALKSDNTKAAQKAIELELFEAISFKNTNLTQHPSINTEALIRCEATGKPKPTVSWKYNGTRVSIGGKYRLTAEGLHISNVTRSDDGEYTCRAEVDEEGRYDERVIQVAVHIPPKIVTQLQSTESVEGRSVTLVCKADALPPPNYRFFKDGVEVLSDKGRMIVDSVTGKLTLNPLNRTDQGNYECRASNDVGQAVSMGQLRVFIPASIDRFYNETLSEGKRLALICQSSGDPSPTVVIQRAGHNYTIEKKGAVEGYQLSSTKAGELVLSVEKVRVEDSGDYKCIAANTVGQQIVSATVTVNYKPRFSKENDLIVYSWAGAKHNLTCQTFGLPAPTITWQRKGVALQSNDTYRIVEWTDGNSTTSSLQVSATKLDVTWIFGTGYNCEATNSLGREKQEFELRRATNPETPKGVRLIEKLADSVTIEIEEPTENGGIPVIGYSVSYAEKVGGSPGADAVMNMERHDDGNDDDDSDDDKGGRNDVKIDRKSGNSVKVIVDQQGNEPYDDLDAKKQKTKGNVLVFNGNRTSIRNLKPETSYLLRVKARNQVGPGPELTYTVTTDKQSPPGKILITSPKRGIDGRKFDLTWEVHNTGGLPIIEYQFNYTKLPKTNEIPKDDWNQKLVPAVSGKNSHELSGLTPQSTYVVQMKARNSLGWSPATERFTFTTVEAAAVGSSAAHQCQKAPLSGMISVLFLFITTLSVRSSYDLSKF